MAPKILEDSKKAAMEPAQHTQIRQFVEVTAHGLRRDTKPVHQIIDQHPAVDFGEIENIDLEPGDLLIFNALLAHGVRPNHSDDRVRMAQYISMHPAEYNNVKEREERIRLWRELDYPKREAFPGDPREWEKKNATTAKLNPLGEKLLGLKPW